MGSVSRRRVTRLEWLGKTLTRKLVSWSLRRKELPVSLRVRILLWVVEKRLRILYMEGSPRWEYRYLKNAILRDCSDVSPGCLTAHARLDPFDIELRACVDSAASTLTRRFVFTNTAVSARQLAYVDVVTPRLRNEPNSSVVASPGTPGNTPVLVQSNSISPNRWIVHSGSGSAGVTTSADVDTISELTARVAGDQPFGGDGSAGPADVGVALGFDFGSVSPAVPETFGRTGAGSGDPCTTPGSAHNTIISWRRR